MKALEIAADICKVFEGFRSKPYMCPAGVPTIGYGTTRYPSGSPVTMNDKPVSKETAEEYLYHELQQSMLSAIRLCPVLLTSDERLAAITDFVYNLGAGRLQESTLRRRINQNNWAEAKKEILRWTRAGGIILPGLVKRREVEASLL